MAEAEDNNTSGGLVDVKLVGSAKLCVQLTAVKGVAMWKQEIPDNCAICSQSLQEPSLDFTCGEETKAGCSIAHGYCGHVFHQECIGNWVESNPSCPQCSTKWELIQLDPVVGYQDWEGAA
eukprot:TRINITY_DN19030_c0_g1_i1.p1 TRINITY_DN19030_c0_g1~~TRINITY_DN19030_c0_g1_i1.p1  ORF type:complete len:121 (+),score=28.70 TRINITY_DN19030_c0_g1_i1:177-539(+)